MKRKAWIAAAVVVLVAGAAWLPVGGVDVTADQAARRASATLDLSPFSDAPPGGKVELLFIHHSCGGQLLAPEGAEDGANCIYRAHPNGGDARALLERAGYVVHEASYGSVVGDRTDLFDWLPKFRTQMERILTTRLQDERLAGATRNQIVAFKSCFPNSDFVGEGTEPGNPAGPELTLANAKATMRGVRGELARHPQVLFVYVTAPPLAPRLPRAPLWKVLAKTALGRQMTEARYRERARVARAFNDWMKSPDGWLAGYDHENVVVFDYFDVLTDEGASNNLRYPTGGGFDSHPSAEGNRRAAAAFVPFLNRAARRAGLVP